MSGNVFAKRGLWGRVTWGVAHSPAGPRARRNLKGGFETSLHNMLRSIEAPLDKAQLKDFSEDAGRVKQFV